MDKREIKNGHALQKVDMHAAIITVDEQEMYIRLELNPEDAYGTVVTAKLEFTKELLQFKINSVETFTREQLIKLLRFNGILFPHKDKHEELVKAYQAFNMQAHIKSNEETDTRGNKAKDFSKKIETNLPVDFKLRLPIFKGQKPETFRVEICMDSTDASIRFWFESVELHDLIEQRKIEIFTERTIKFDNFVIIKK